MEAGCQPHIDTSSIEPRLINRWLVNKEVSPFFSGGSSLLAAMLTSGQYIECWPQISQPQFINMGVGAAPKAV